MWAAALEAAAAADDAMPVVGEASSVSSEESQIYITIAT